MAQIECSLQNILEVIRKRAARMVVVFKDQIITAVGITFTDHADKTKAIINHVERELSVIAQRFGRIDRRVAIITAVTKTILHVVGVTVQEIMALKARTA